ncbi:MAG: hypothetical protein GY862_19840 [Gammaproteobacteria bacterium]|nr:hypothetical protein [Gammaproteobacteria bacterium]
MLCLYANIVPIFIAWDDRLDAVAAGLYSATGLYNPGYAAAKAVRKLGLKRPRCALHQWLRPSAWFEWQRLHSLARPENVEGDSAELGMALVLLMGASGSREHTVIATGKLDGKIFSGDRQNDTRIAPVGSLKEKLELVLRDFPETPAAEKTLFFIPGQVSPQDPAPAGENREIQEVIGKLRERRIEVMPVEFLSDAARTLKAYKAGYTFWDRVLKWLFCVLLPILLICLGSVLGYGKGWADRALEMRFVPGDNVIAPHAEPFVVCRNGEIYEYLALEKDEDGFVPILYPDETLGWRVRIGESAGMDALLHEHIGYQGYYVAMANVSEFSRTYIKAAEDEYHRPVRIAPGELWEWRWTFQLPAGRQQEENVLILLAQRHAPFNSDIMHKALAAYLADFSADDNVSPHFDAARAFIIRSLAPGTVGFPFRIAAGERECVR